MPPPPLESIVPNLYPRSDSAIVFPRFGGGTLTLKVIESKESRSLGSSYELVYDVFLDPPAEGLFTDYLAIGTNRQAAISDELIVGWNVFDWASWTFFDLTLVKRWPMKCTRVRHNEYKVKITYAPLNIVNFQITPVKTKRHYALDTIGFSLSPGAEPGGGGAYNQMPSAVDMDAFLGLRAINTDLESRIAQGVDVIEPTFSWTERWNWGPYAWLATVVEEDEWTHYFGAMTSLSSTVNEQPFRGCAPGTVRFDGGSGRQSHPLTWEIDYRFSYKPLKEKHEFGGIELEVPEAAQGGWNFLDTSSPGEREVTWEGRKYIVLVPDIVKLHQLYPLRDFGPLGLFPDIYLGTTSFFAYISELPMLGGRVTSGYVE